MDARQIRLTLGLTGATGFVGRSVTALAAERGHTVVPFSRSARSGFRTFAPGSPPDLSGLDAVIHLAGEPILGLWTPEKRRRIVSSRVEGTRGIVDALARPGAPRTLICASAIGFYGDTGETAVDEATPAGRGFLAETCVQWEAEALRAETLGVRVVRLRIGFVLGRDGAMKLILPVFRTGLGGNLGSGRQWMSGVHVEDVAGLALWAAESDGVSGPVNAVMPDPFRNADFTRAVARAVHRPAFLPAPALALRLALGDLSHVLLDSTRVRPTRALTDGYVFRFANLAAALQNVTR